MAAPRIGCTNLHEVAVPGVTRTPWCQATTRIGDPIPTWTSAAACLPVPRRPIGKTMNHQAREPKNTQKMYKIAAIGQQSCFAFQQPCCQSHSRSSCFVGVLSSSSGPAV